MNFRTLTINKPMTKGELSKLNARLDEINAILELTDEFDILYNLDNELDQILAYLKYSLSFTEKNIKVSRIGLKVV